jgi:hypothetical protein
MAYNDFTTIAKVQQKFQLIINEGIRFLPDIGPIAASPALTQFLEEGIPLAIATGSEKARSELIISPILLEIRRNLKRQISLFSGEDFDVDIANGLNGRCDFLISRSSIQSEIEAPAIVIIEAKKGELKKGIGQCLAEMVAAQKFNQERGNVVKFIYGGVTSGTLWRFLKLEGNLVTIELSEYQLPPIEPILGILTWMIQDI